MFPLNEYAKIKNLLLEVKLLVLRSVHLLHDEEKQTQPTLKKRNHTRTRTYQEKVLIKFNGRNL